MATGYVWEELYGWHDTGTAAGLMQSDPAGGLQPLKHFENAETKVRLHELLAVSGMLDQLVRLRARPATEEEILRVHAGTHLERVKADSALPKGGDAGDGMSPSGQGGYEIACLAAGGTIVATDAVLSGEVANAYALVRPPGHHALPEHGMGFCVFGNVAIAARHARAAHGVERIAVVDWDVHHGNGTQAVFRDDPATLTVSVHQDRCFPPGSGLLTERGEGAGEGYAVNVPLPPGSGDQAHVAVVDRVVAPALERFRPDLVFVASGFDGNTMEPLARQMVTSQGYRTMTERLLAVVESVCGGRLVCSHEGGYSPVYVPFCGLAVLEALAGVRSKVSDPYGPIAGGFGGQELQPHQERVVDQAAALVAGVGGPS